MRYKEAYEMIDMSLLRAKVGFPVSISLKNVLFDQAVQKIGTTICKRKRSLTIASPDIVNQISRSDFTRKVYKVEENDKNLPFISEETMNTNSDTDDISHNAWFVKEDYNEGTISAIARSVSGDTTFAVTYATVDSASPTVGAYVKFSEIVGCGAASGTSVENEPHPLNGKLIQIATDDGTDMGFTLTGDLDANYVAYASGGIWQEESLSIQFLKKPTYGVKIYYYAKPRVRTSLISEVDLPDIIVPGVVHMVLGNLLAQDGQMRLAAAHRGMGRSIFEDYMKSRTSREQFPDVLPFPMPDFK